MLRKSKDLEGCAIGTVDGPIGDVTDLYFDDERWVIRYFVVSTGAWLANRQVLISPFAVGQPRWTGKLLPASITKEQVRNSPDIDTNKPVSRQHELDYLKYYRYPYYWGGTHLWGVGPSPNMLPPPPGYGWSDEHYRLALDALERAQNGERTKEDPHLRSCNAVMKYHIHAADGDIGHVQGFLVEDETWAIRYLIVNTSNWWLGHEVLVAPQWIDKVSWADSKVSVDLPRRALQEAPPYDAASPLGRAQEIELFKHYGRSGYWAQDGKPDGTK